MNDSRDDLFFSGNFLTYLRENTFVRLTNLKVGYPGTPPGIRQIILPPLPPARDGNRTFLVYDMRLESKKCVSNKVLLKRAPLFNFRVIL
jgi:hypothetical protein